MVEVGRVGWKSVLVERKKLELRSICPGGNWARAFQQNSLGVAGGF